MSSGFEVIILLAVAVVLLVRLIGVLGRRDGFEPEQRPLARPKPANDPFVQDDDEDFDLEQYGADEAMREALAGAKKAEPEFRVDDFLAGSKAAYEMILMGFLQGDMSEVEPFVDKNVLAGFNQAIAQREQAGERIEAEFVGIKDVALRSAEFDQKSKELVLGIDYTAELRRLVYDKDNKLIQGEKNKVETELDHWQFARLMGSDDPNWTLVATGE